MASAESKLPKRSFFSVYKPGQGKFVRWGTVAAVAILVLTGAWWLAEGTQLQSATIELKFGAVVLWIALGTLLAFWVVNKPSLAEFMIMTESEMRKVTWPTRQTVINSTKVVIYLTLLLALLLYVVDAGFVKFFEAIKLLKN